VLLLMALAMLNAQVGGMRQSRVEEEELESGIYSGVVPLAVPLLAGPGAIGTTIIAAQAGGFTHIAIVIGCILLVCAILWAVLRLDDGVGQRMGRTGLNIATRLLCLLLAAIAVDAVARVRRTHQWIELEGLRSEPLRADEYGDVAGPEATSSAGTFAAAGAVMGRYSPDHHAGTTALATVPAVREEFFDVRSRGPRLDGLRQTS